MKPRQFSLPAVFLFFITISGMTCPAATRYVSLHGGHVAPFVSWSDAATNIQAAVDWSSDNDVIYVSNGVYNSGYTSPGDFSTKDRVAIEGNITVCSLNGPEYTLILGAPDPVSGGLGENAIRCARLTSGARMIGFTLSNGYTRSVGTHRGGGATLFSSCMLSNCIIKGNYSLSGADGVHLIQNNTLINCIVRGNGYSDHSAVYCFGGSSIIRSLVCYNAGRGISLSSDCTADVCRVYYNTGGGISANGSAVIRNCLLVGNERLAGSEDGGGIYYNGGPVVIENCTICFNQAGDNGGGIYMNNSYSGSAIIRNNIISYNLAPAGANHYNEDNTPRYSFNCTTPAITGAWDAGGNITANPGIVSTARGDYRLKHTSACRDAGGNETWMNNARDLDGRRRIINLTVDMGAFEFVPEHTGTSADHYVSRTGSDTWPYLSWGDAARNIQDAVDAAGAGDTVHVAEGVYASGLKTVLSMRNRVALTRPVTVAAVNGDPLRTVIAGEPDMRTGGIGNLASRCVFVTNGARLTGFTLTNGFTWFGRYPGSIPTHGGGGALLYNGGMLSNCLVQGNAAGAGGGVCGYGPCRFAHSTILGNVASSGGGAACIDGAMIDTCIVAGNLGTNTGGGIYMASGTARNCVIYRNFAFNSGGGIYAAGGNTLENDTIAGNVALGGGGVFYTGSLSETINCIVYTNWALIAGRNWYADPGSMAFTSSCTVPDPGGEGNVIGDPLFSDPGEADYRLADFTPCLDEGTNLPWTLAPGATDLDGYARIKDCGANRVDMGAYEFPHGRSTYRIPVHCPEWRLKRGKKSVLKGKPVTPLLAGLLTNGHGIGIWDPGTHSDVVGPRPLVTKNNRVWKFKDTIDKTVRISYSEKQNRRKGTYKTKLKYRYRGDIPETNIVYMMPVSD